MFEDSLLESTGRIRTHSRYFAVGSFALQALLLTALVLYPLAHPALLPKQSLTMLLTAPPLPSAPANLPERTAASPARPALLVNPLAMPSRIPQHAVMVTEALPSGVDSRFAQSNGSIPGGIFDLIGSVPGQPVVKPAPVKGPIRVSSGVAAGQLLTSIQPVYPAIAKEAHISGTVVVQAMIAKDGSIQHVQVISGPPLLRQAALDAIARARYRPFLLNGEPVEIETTINVVFTMN
ncbi:MAG TPA: energy transducer TonB [Pseudacidobacterium sp.]|nr:energy transducer TonB [Pseudacidobacterium sp.]